jgi:hypothetical protein
MPPHPGKAEYWMVFAVSSPLFLRHALLHQLIDLLGIKAFGDEVLSDLFERFFGCLHGMFSSTILMPECEGFLH